MYRTARWWLRRVGGRKKSWSLDRRKSFLSVDRYRRPADILWTFQRDPSIDAVAGLFRIFCSWVSSPFFVFSLDVEIGGERCNNKLLEWWPMKIIRQFPRPALCHTICEHVCRPYPIPSFIFSKNKSRLLFSLLGQFPQESGTHNSHAPAHWRQEIDRWAAARPEGYFRFIICFKFPLDFWGSLSNSKRYPVSCISVEFNKYNSLTSTRNVRFHSHDFIPNQEEKGYAHFYGILPQIWLPSKLIWQKFNQIKVSPILVLMMYDMVLRF